MGAFVASATLVPAPCHARSTARSSPDGSSRCGSPFLAKRASRALERAGGEPVTRGTLRFEIPAGPLSAVLAEIQRLSGLTITLTNQRIGDVASPRRVRPVHARRGARARARGHQRHARA